jgi:hypothetical protein
MVKFFGLFKEGRVYWSFVEVPFFHRLQVWDWRSGFVSKDSRWTMGAGLGKGV